MQPVGYLHDKMDVKVLILFILARINTPVTGQEIYEVAFQDDSLNYFVFSECLPELVSSGHLVLDDHDRYTITEKGKQQGAVVEDSLAVPVVRKVTAAIEKKNDELLRSGYITTSVAQNEKGFWIVTLNYKDNDMPLMTLSLMAPSEELGQVMAKRLRKNADALYRQAVTATIESSKRSDGI